MRPFLFATCLFVSIAAAGCTDGTQTVRELPPPAEKKKQQEPAVVGEFDPQGDKQEVDSSIRMSNPITGPLEAYQPLKQQVIGLGIDKAVSLFHALEGRYPKDLDEFMTKIIKQNHIKLPKLPSGQSYEYDAANHKLLIVEDKRPAAKD